MYYYPFIRRFVFGSRFPVKIGGSCCDEIRLESIKYLQKYPLRVKKQKGLLWGVDSVDASGELGALQPEPKSSRGTDLHFAHFLPVLRYICFIRCVHCGAIIACFIIKKKYGSRFFFRNVRIFVNRNVSVRRKKLEFATTRLFLIACKLN